MHSAVLALALGAFFVASFVDAQIPEYIPPRLRITQDPTCNGGTLLNVIRECAVLGSGLCENYETADLGLELDINGGATVYVSGADVYTTGSRLLIFDRSTENPTCGQMAAILTPETVCRQFTLPARFALGCCAGSDNCNAVIPSSERRALEFPQSAAVNLFPKRTTNEEVARHHARDISPVLGGPLTKRQGSCRWEPTSDEPRDVNGEVQVIATDLACPPGAPEAGCAIERDITTTTSQSNTFGVSTEVGGSFFEVIQASISFSYEYTFTEENSQSSSYTVPLRPGQTGYLTFTPTLQCTWGTFSGDCDWENRDQGRACVPRYLNDDPDGQMSGTIRFVEQLLAPPAH